MLGTIQLSNGAKLVKIRNPWGTEGFNGAYSDDSELWDEKAKKEAGHREKNDGIFFTDI